MLKHNCFLPLLLSFLCKCVLCSSLSSMCVCFFWALPVSLLCCWSLQFCQLLEKALTSVAVRADVSLLDSSDNSCMSSVLESVEVSNSTANRSSWGLSSFCLHSRSMCIMTAISLFQQSSEIPFLPLYAVLTGGSLLLLLISGSSLAQELLETAVAVSSVVSDFSVAACCTSVIPDAPTTETHSASFSECVLDVSLESRMYSGLSLWGSYSSGDSCGALLI